MSIGHILQKIGVSLMYIPILFFAIGFYAWMGMISYDIVFLRWNHFFSYEPMVVIFPIIFLIATGAILHELGSSIQKIGTTKEDSE